MTVALPAEALHVPTHGEVALRIDDLETGTGGGFAIEFVAAYVNPREPDEE